MELCDEVCLYKLKYCYGGFVKVILYVKVFCFCLYYKVGILVVINDFNGLLYNFVCI